MDRHSYPPTPAAARGCNAIVSVTLTCVVTRHRGWWHLGTQCQELHAKTRRGLGHDAFDQTAHPSIEPPVDVGGWRSDARGRMQVVSGIYRGGRAPRVHFEDGIVYAEPGIDTTSLEQAGRAIGRFRELNLFFGGVQAAVRDRQGRLSGGGDPRRGGASVVVERA